MFTQKSRRLFHRAFTLGMALLLVMGLFVTGQAGHAAPLAGPNLAPPANYVQVISGHFYVNNAPFRNVGVNVASILYMYKYHGEGNFRAELQALKDAGITHIRVFLSNDKLTKEQIGDNLEAALNIIQGYGIYVTVALTDYYGQPVWINDANYVVQGDENSFQTCSVGRCLKPIWVESGYRTNYLPFVQYTVNRFKNNPAIFAWEVGNEIKHEGGNGTALLNFYNDVVANIRQLDSNHMIATGIVDTGWASISPNSLYQNANINFITIHHYVDSSSDTNPAAWPDMNLANQYGKPLVIEEIGVHKNVVAAQGFSFVRSVYTSAYNQPGVDSILQWGGGLTYDYGSTHADYGPFKQGLVNEYKTLWHDLATTVPPASLHLDVFVRGSDNQTIWHRWQTNGSWAAWESLGIPTGGAQSAPSAVSWGVNRIDLFVLCGTNPTNLCHKWFDGTWHSWESWGNPGMSLIYAPDAASMSSGTLEVFAVGSNQKIYQIRYYSGSQHGWQQPFNDGTANSAVSAVSWGGNRLDVFVRGTDNQLYQRTWSGSWGGWSSLGGTLTTGPDASSWGVGEMDVVVASSGGVLWYRRYNNGWGTWQQFPDGSTTVDPSGVSPAANRVDFFARGTDNKLYHRTWNGSWSTWENLDGVLSTGPDAASWSLR